jgi:predicted methyltransferase
MKAITALLIIATFIAAPSSLADPAMQARIEAQMAALDRHEFDLPRDEARKPYETFVFLGLEAGMVALDVGAYAGYTTEMLSAAVGATGRVYSHNTERVLERYAEGYYKRTMTERLADDRLPNTVLHISQYDDFGLPGRVDVAFLGNLLHDFYYRDGPETTMRFLSAIRTALKPHGVLGITDHVGIAGQDNATLHRLEPAIARDLLEASGFHIEASSDLFANPEDDHLLMVYDQRIYRNTDRFFFKAVPAPEEVP